MHLRPSVLLFLRTVWGGMLLVTVAGYFWQGMVENLWWSFDYVISMLIPFTVMPLFLWFMFVPKEIVISDRFVVITFSLRSARRFEWNGLRYWGDNVHLMFVLQFTNSRTQQLALFAFPKDQQQQFKKFVKGRFPKRKARGWFADQGFG